MSNANKCTSCGADVRHTEWFQCIAYLKVGSDSARNEVKSLQSRLVSCELQRDEWKKYADAGLSSYAELQSEVASLSSRLSTALKALEPFAEVGQWLFAQPDVPDAAPMVHINGLNGMNGALTRGHFKAAHSARAVENRTLSPAPCIVCGYNGPGYYQAETHPCAKSVVGETPCSHVWEQTSADTGFCKLCGTPWESVVERQTLK